MPEYHITISKHKYELLLEFSRLNEKVKSGKSRFLINNKDEGYFFIKEFEKQISKYEKRAISVISTNATVSYGGRKGTSMIRIDGKCRQCHEQSKLKNVYLITIAIPEEDCVEVKVCIQVAHQHIKESLKSRRCCLIPLFVKDAKDVEHYW